MIRTKLHRPPVTKEHVYRDHLIESLHSNQYKPFTLVSASAGYGKSMLISSWLEKCACPYAWVSLHDDDNELHSFLNCIYLSILKMHPDALKNFSRIVEVSELPPLKIISETLINDLDNISGEFVFVLDDYHLIHNQQIHELIDLILKYPPQDMHMVVIARRDPAFDLSSLRAHSRMNELRMSDLCFTSKEIVILFKHLLGADLTDETVDNLLKKTEGWITGLCLASLLVTQPKDTNLILQNLEGDVNLIADFLVKDVLQKQPEEMQKLLLLTAVLNRFSAGLIDSLEPDENKDSKHEVSGQVFIDWLIKSNMFVISLDEKNKWFRYHHLFQEMMQNQLIQKYNKEKVRYIHKLASKWFEEKKNIEDAIYHTLKSGDEQRAVEIILKYRNEMMCTEQWVRLNIWISMLPDEIIQSNPHLLIITAFYFDYTGNTEEAIALLEQIESLIAALDPNSAEYLVMQGEYFSLLSQKLFLMGQVEQALTTSKKALKLLPFNAEYPFTFGVYWAVFSLQQQGNELEAEKFVLDIVNSLDIKNSRLEARLNVALCGLYFLQGELSKLEVAAKRALKLGTRYKLQESIDLSHYFLGSVHYFRNELDRAETHFELLFENRYNNRLTYAVIGKCIIALIHDNKGLHKKASEDLTTLAEFAENISSPGIHEYERAINVEIALKNGQVSRAIELDMGKEYGVFPPLWFVFLPQLTSIKVLMASDTIANNPLILEKLNQYLEYARTNSNHTCEIRFLAMKAMHLFNTGNELKAKDAISESLRLAEPSRFIRMYLDGNKKMENLIKGLPDQHENKSFINQILRAFEIENESIKTANKESGNQKSKYFEETSNIDTLSFREMDVLKQLAQGLRNKEISDILFISPETVKKHLSNVYAKLNVNNRIHAVNTAIKLGIVEKNRSLPISKGIHS